MGRDGEVSGSVLARACWCFSFLTKYTNWRIIGKGNDCIERCSQLCQEKSHLLPQKKYRLFGPSSKQTLVVERSPKRKKSAKSSKKRRRICSQRWPVVTSVSVILKS